MYLLEKQAWLPLACLAKFLELFSIKFVELQAWGDSKAVFQYTKKYSKHVIKPIVK